MNLGVIMGGMSTEHNVSIVSGTSIIKNFNKEKIFLLNLGFLFNTVFNNKKFE